VFGIVGVMSTPTERNWTAHLVISSEHAGLRPHFKALEAALYRALARIDDPRDVMEYLSLLRRASEAWLKVNEQNLHQK
jgi:hypothetical protein